LDPPRSRTGTLIEFQISDDSGARRIDKIRLVDFHTAAILTVHSCSLQNYGVCQAVILAGGNRFKGDDQHGCDKFSGTAG
jgi:hypothetical protein